MADVTMPIPQTAPERYRRAGLTHATLYADGRVAVGTMSRIGLLGHIIDVVAASQDEAGLMAALAEEDRLLLRPLTESQLAALELEPWCGVRCD